MRNNRMHLVFKQLSAFFLMLALFFSMLVPVAFAAGRIDLERETTLSLHFGYNNTAIAGARFRLYRVADVSESVRFTLSGDFQDYKVNLNRLDADGWNAAGNTLAVYAAADHINPVAVRSTDNSGQLSFGTLDVGLYLVTAESKTIGKKTYRSAPFLVCLPSLEDDVWKYDVTVEPKCTMESHPGGGEERPNPDTKEVTVLKVWDDEGYQEQRPQKVEVSLLRDGSVHRTVVLSAENYWRYTWSDLSNQYDWTVVERNVPEPYWVTYTENATVLKVTNTYMEDISDEPPPGGEKPDGTEPAMAEDIPDDPIPTGKLPQTGLLWWPVPILTIVGLTLFSIGWFCSFKGQER
ncbi:Cna B-type domain-containing protein [Clostridium sp. D33t1_170424_F3]|uniref:Cna B-type domain-containing protein n=1 Tax=Clostridium sp. D33t1_170424_F3 TaxID=2787099 RepID=UPI0018A9DE0C|nr:Cna B-type domain-containing protein [Clostridium sp. D33t1_170424_F3]